MTNLVLRCLVALVALVVYNVLGWLSGSVVLVALGVVLMVLSSLRVDR